METTKMLFLETQPWKNYRFLCILKIMVNENCSTARRRKDVNRRMERDGTGTKKNGNLYSLQYTEIAQVFFTPHQGCWRQQGDKGNYKYNNSILGHCCDKLIQGHCCEPTTTLVQLL
jgi:hypothetical protein